jgi:uncharacterized protein (TIGR00369 family)
MNSNRIDDTPADDVPTGFRPLVAGGPYFRQIGPTYVRIDDAGLFVLGLRVTPEHTNMQGVTHGGMLATVADAALGIAIARDRGIRAAQVTVSLALDYLSGARPGDWLEARVQVIRRGQRLAFAECNLFVGDKRILRGSGVFAFVDRELPKDIPPLPDLGGGFPDG